MTILHKENAKTHNPNIRIREPSPVKLKLDAEFKVPEPKNSPALGPRRGSVGSEVFPMGDIKSSPPTKIRKDKNLQVF